MAIDEQSRHELYLKLEELLGRDEATTLMEHLPPVGWADVATKRDLDQFAHNFDQLAHNIEQVERRIIAEVRADFRSELMTLQRHMVSWMVALNVTFSGAVLAAAKLL